MKQIKNIFYCVFSLAALALTPSLPMDSYAPTLPYIQKYFSITDSEVQLTISLFAFTTGFGQLIFGPFSDYTGRRITAFIVMGLFAIGSFWYMHADSYKEFLFSRFFQGLGASGMGVIAYTIVRDVFSGEKLSKVYGYLVAVCAFAPVVAPLVGGYLARQFDWQSVGYFYLLFVLIAMVSMYSLIPETLPQEKRIKLKLSLFKKYKKIILDKGFLFYTLMSAIGLTIPFIFTSISVHIIVRILHYSHQAYDIIYSCYGIVFMAGNFTAGYLAEKIGIDKIILYGLLLAMVSAIGMLVWSYYGGLSLYSFYIPMMLAIIGGTLSMIGGIGGAVEGFSKNTGAAVALSSTLRLIFTSLVGIIVVDKNVQSILPVGISITILNIIGIVFFYGRNFSFEKWLHKSK